MSNNREKMLLSMYDQLFNDINRHITVIWQSISVVVGAFAVFALVEKKVISIDIACAIIVLLVSWLIAHLYDAAYWYNRNLTMIANIERQFLRKSDLKDVHYYFGKHRPSNSMLTHLRIQYALGVGLGCLVLLYHFFNRVIPGLSYDALTYNRNIYPSQAERIREFFALICNFKPETVLPYILVIASMIYLLYLRKNRNDCYKEFLENSPGISVDTKGIKYGIGHGYKNKKTKSNK